MEKRMDGGLEKNKDDEGEPIRNVSNLCFGYKSYVQADREL